MQIGTQIGRYEIGEKIGSGGMGEVYIARDTQLERDVAIKVLLPEIAGDIERVRRFKREAKIASALNHPNIITIHEIIENDGRIFIVSEYVVGTTLREKISKNQLTVPEMLDIASQVVDALAAAHDAGIVHRDIKPENIMIRRDGYAKVLDFGLAKQSVIETEAIENDSTVVNTQEGVILGSVSYMSPEQIREGGVDRRTDIWSLGVVLYEMLTGRNPFKGDTTGDSIAAILNADAEPIEKSLAGLPIELENVCGRALEKDVNQRYQDIYEFSDELETVRERIKDGHLLRRVEQTARGDETVEFHGRSTDETPTLIQDSDSQYLKPNTREASTDRPGKRNILLRKKWLMVPAAALAGLVLFAFYNFFHPNLFPNYYNRFENKEIVQLTDDGNSHSAAISPDGNLIAFVRDADDGQELVVRNVENGEETIIEPASNSVLLQPTFAPDGRALYFVRVDGGLGTLYETGIRSGPAGEIGPDRGASFARTVIVNVDSRISFSPDGDRFAFIRRDEAAGDHVLIAERYSFPVTDVTRRLSTTETEFKRFDEISWQNTKEQFTIIGSLKTDLSGYLTAMTFGEAGLFGSGHWSYSRARFLSNYTWLQDGTRFHLGRSPQGMTRRIHYDAPAFYRAKRIISEDGQDYSSIDVSFDGNTIVATRTTTLSAVWSYDPHSGLLKELLPESDTLVGDEGVLEVADGKILFVRTTDEDIYSTHSHNGVEEQVWVSNARQLFIADSDGTGERQLASNGDYGNDPVVTSGGEHILYRYGSSGRVIRMDSNGENIADIEAKIWPADKIEITPDGTTIIFTKTGNKPALMRIPVDGGTPEELIQDSPTFDYNPELSHDGSYLAYISAQFDKPSSTYRELVKVVRFDNGSLGDTVFENQLDFPSNFHWSPDNKSLCFVKRDRVENIVCRSILDNREYTITKFESGKIASFSWSKDGKRLLIVRTREMNDVVLIKDADKAD